MKPISTKVQWLLNLPPVNYCKSISPFALDGKQLQMKFYPDPKKTSTYLELAGEITAIGLRLDLTQHFMNYEKGDFDHQLLFQGAEFVFLPAH